MLEELEKWEQDVASYWIDYILEQGDALPRSHTSTIFKAFRAGYGLGYDDGHVVGWQQAKEAKCNSRTSS